MQAFINEIHPILSLAVKSVFRFYSKWDIFSDFKALCRPPFKKKCICQSRFYRKIDGLLVLG